MRHWAFAIAALLLVAAAPLGLLAQSSQASLSGRVTDAATGTLLAKALVAYKNLQTNAQSLSYSNEQGIYAFLSLAPGTYSVQVHALGYQPQLVESVELAVAARVELNLAVHAAGQPPPAVRTPPVPGAHGGAPSKVSAALDALYGADAQKPTVVLSEITLPLTDTAQGSLSTVIDERKILELGPILELGGNDIYNLLVLLPGVTSDSATARGLGSAVNGQRATSSNFLLDGVDNNDLLASGPATRVATDAVKEFRITTNSYSAEYGRASGFIAQAITRSGTNSIHGTAYEYFKHDRLDANTFANNWQGVPRAPFRQNQYGGSLGGPIRRDRLFFFGNVERAPSATLGSPITEYVLVTPVSFFAPSPIAKGLLSSYPSPNGTAVPGNPFINSIRVAPPFNEQATLGLGRADWNSTDGRNHVSVRYALSDRTVDNTAFSAYPAFRSPLDVGDRNIAVGYIRELSRGTNEVKVAYNRSGVSILRKQPDIPTLVSLDGVSLPGSPSAYDYLFRDRTVQVVDNGRLSWGRHEFTTGGEWRHVLDDSLLSPARDGYYIFYSFLDFLFDNPAYLLYSLNAKTGQPSQPSDFWRYYKQDEFSGFLQDNIKVRPSLTVNVGIRYEYFGVPQNTQGAPNTNIVFGSGSNIGERLAHASFQTGQLYHPDHKDFAGRFGFAWDLTGAGKTVLRGGYGIFYDRIFDNFWLDTRLNSSVTQLFANLSGQSKQFQYSLPARQGVSAVSLSDLQSNTAVMVDQGLRTPYSQSWFLGLQRQFGRNYLVEVHHAGSLGRRLLTADVINRLWSVPPTLQSSAGRFNPSLPDISYRANQGHSDFAALEVQVTRHWSKGAQFQVAYTLSRTRDVQSDPLLKNPFLQSASLQNPSFLQAAGSFTRQFDPNSDYGLSDFDQKHNLVFSVVYESPGFRGWRRVTGRWQMAALGALRSGFPFSVYTTQLFIPNSGGRFINNRANFTGGDSATAFLSNPAPVAGGLGLLNAASFQAPANGALGNTARNGFIGPGFWSADFAMGRGFAVPRTGERVRLQFRAEFLNLFNHSNLGAPNPFLESSEFGQAMFGRQGFLSALPTVLPESEQPRRIQLALKLVF